MATKYCAQCEQYLDTSKFWKNKARHDGWQTHCIECQKRYDKDNPEQRARRTKRWKDKRDPLAKYKGGKAQDALEQFMAGDDVTVVFTDDIEGVLEDFLGEEE